MQPLPRGARILRGADMTARLYETAVQAGPDGFVVLDARGHILRVNPTFERQSGYTQEELVGTPFAQLELIGLGMASKVFSTPEHREGRQRRKDGAAWDVEYALSNDGTHWFIFCREITHRKTTEGLLAARELLSRIAVEGTLDEVIQATLDAAETVTGSSIGFMHFVEANQIDLTLQAWSTNTLRHMCTAEGKGAHYPIDLAGVWVDCVRSRRPVIHNDYQALPHKKGLPEGHAPIVRELVLPVLRGDLVTAILGVGNKKTPYTEHDVNVVGTLASLCIDLVGRKRVEEQLQISEDSSRAHRALDGERGRALLRRCIENFCSAFGIALDDERRSLMVSRDEAELTTLLDQLYRDRQWPTPP